MIPEPTSESVGLLEIGAMVLTALFGGLFGFTHRRIARLEETQRADVADLRAEASAAADHVRADASALSGRIEARLSVLHARLDQTPTRQDLRDWIAALDRSRA
jgi:hypothetical protein